MSFCWDEQNCPFKVGVWQGLTAGSFVSFTVQWKSSACELRELK